MTIFRLAVAAPAYSLYFLVDHLCCYSQRRFRLDLYPFLFPENGRMHKLGIWSSAVLRGTGASSAP